MLCWSSTQCCNFDHVRWFCKKTTLLLTKDSLKHGKGGVWGLMCIVHVYNFFHQSSLSLAQQYPLLPWPTPWLSIDLTMTPINVVFITFLVHSCLPLHGNDHLLSTLGLGLYLLVHPSLLLVSWSIGKNLLLIFPSPPIVKSPPWPANTQTKRHVCAVTISPLVGHKQKQLN